MPVSGDPLILYNCEVRFLGKYIDDILLAIGMTLVSYGVFMIYTPAGFIILGACFIAFAYFYAKRR